MPFLIKSYTLIFLAMMSSSIFANTRNTTPPQPRPSQETQLKQSNVGPYLGLRVDVLPKELIAQLPEDILVGQGIMVSGYMDKSPAPQQGIQLYDIILNYNQHALMHPSTIIQLIKRQKPGDKAELTIARKGKVFKLPITIGSQNYSLNEDQLDYQYNLQVLGYDGVKIKQHSKHHFEATIRYLAPDGVVRRKTFSGVYPKVQRDIYTSPDLSNIAKQDLLRAISKRKSDEEGWFGDILPFSDGNFF